MKIQIEGSKKQLFDHNIVNFNVEQDEISLINKGFLIYRPKLGFPKKKNRQPKFLSSNSKTMIDYNNKQLNSNDLTDSLKKHSKG